jgi:hypothetical protein
MAKLLLTVAAVCAVALGSTLAYAAATGTVRLVSSFHVGQSPSGMHFHPDHNLLYILCGTSTNGDHTLYAYTTSGQQRCTITIPSSVGMSRVDGFQISGSTAYIVDSQGPIYASTKLGGSMYAVPWTNPCGCNADSTCTSTTATWSPTITKKYTLSANDASIGDGGSVDDYFRNSGIAVVGDSFYSVNGVHPVGSGGLSCCYKKSVTKSLLSGSGMPVTQKWSFDATTLGRDVDMEGLTCGADSCGTYLYIGDEYNYVYKLRLATAASASAVETEWNLRTIVGNVEADKGIEALTYASTTGYFYAGIQETSMVHVVELTDSSSSATTTTSTGATTTSPTTTTASSTATTPTPGATSSSSSARAVSLAAVFVLMTAAAALF